MLGSASLCALNQTTAAINSSAFIRPVAVSLLALAPNLFRSSSQAAGFSSSTAAAYSSKIAAVRQLSGHTSVSKTSAPFPLSRPETSKFTQMWTARQFASSAVSTYCTREEAHSCCRGLFCCVPGCYDSACLCLSTAEWVSMLPTSSCSCSSTCGDATPPFQCSRSPSCLMRPSSARRRRPSRRRRRGFPTCWKLGGRGRSCPHPP